MFRPLCGNLQGGINTNTVTVTKEPFHNWKWSYSRSINSVVKKITNFLGSASSTTVLHTQYVYILCYEYIYIVARFLTCMFLLLAQNGGLLHCTLYAHHPLRCGILHNILSLYFKLIFVINFSTVEFIPW